MGSVCRAAISSSAVINFEDASRQSPIRKGDAVLESVVKRILIGDSDFGGSANSSEGNSKSGSGLKILSSNRVCTESEYTVYCESSKASSGIVGKD